MMIFRKHDLIVNIESLKIKKKENIMTKYEQFMRMKFTHELREKAKKIKEEKSKQKPICDYLKYRSDKALRHRARTGWTNR